MWQGYGPAPIVLSILAGSALVFKVDPISRRG